MCSYNPLHIEKVALAVTAGVAGATAISDEAAHRLGVWGVPLGLLIASVSIALFGQLGLYRDRFTHCSRAAPGSDLFIGR